MRAAPTMRSLVEAYLTARRQMGFDLKIAGSQLLAFARFADQKGHHGPMTTALAVQWAQDASRATSLTWARRIEVLRPFMKYRTQFDGGTETAPPGLFGRAHRRLVPHIYTEREIDALLRAAARLQPANSLRPLTYYTLFGLLASTGLRLSEALTLSAREVDVTEELLTVRMTKFRKSRLVPLHPTTAASLKEYIRARRRTVDDRQIDTFFVSARHRPLVNRTVHSTFEALRARLGWKGRGDYPAPRLHDLRHTFICRALLRRYHEGQDVDSFIDVLSTYVGHAKVSDTYWYVTGIPELLRLAGQRFEHFSERGTR